jgi:hypothetical protein
MDEKENLAYTEQPDIPVSYAELVDLMTDTNNGTIVEVRPAHSFKRTKDEFAS